MSNATATEVILIGGRSGVGKTSVAMAASRILAGLGIRHAVIEGDNLDQAYPEPWREGHSLAELNLAAMWDNYRAAGYSRLIYTNTVSVLQVPELNAALGGAVRSFAALLTATDTTAAERLTRREHPAALDKHIHRSNEAAQELDATASATRIVTDGRSIIDVAEEVLAEAGWVSTARLPRRD